MLRGQLLFSYKNEVDVSHVPLTFCIELSEFPGDRTRLPTISICSYTRAVFASEKRLCNQDFAIPQAVVEMMSTEFARVCQPRLVEAAIDAAVLRCQRSIAGSGSFSEVALEAASRPVSGTGDGEPGAGGESCCGAVADGVRGDVGDYADAESRRQEGLRLQEELLPVVLGTLACSQSCIPWVEKGTPLEIYRQDYTAEGSSIRRGIF